MAAKEFIKGPGVPRHLCALYFGANVIFKERCLNDPILFDPEELSGSEVVAPALHPAPRTAVLLCVLSGEPVVPSSELHSFFQMSPVWGKRAEGNKRAALQASVGASEVESAPRS